MPSSDEAATRNFSPDCAWAGEPAFSCEQDLLMVHSLKKYAGIVAARAGAETTATKSWATKNNTNGAMRVRDMEISSV